jgi:1,2-diacylglycerol 3-beta-galactosyltransferase
MILKPKFYERPRLDVPAERERLGLSANLPTGIVLFGGHGAPVMAEIGLQLDAIPRGVQLIMICGHNQKLYAQLSAMRTHRPMFVAGFTTNVAHYMALSDFFIGKPGPGSISEALQFDLPVVVERNKKTMPQERYNTAWIAEKRLGIVLRSFGEIAAGVEQLLREETFAELRANARAYSNRAIFEIPSILDEVLERHVPYSVPVSPAFTDVSVGRGAAWAGTSGMP